MSRLSLLLALLLLAACRGPRGHSLSKDQLEQLRASDGYAAGEISDLARYALLDERDFCYSIAFSRDGQQVAYSHLASKVYQVGVWTLAPPPFARSNFDVNPNQWDVESLDFSPDGAVVVTAGRDGVVRFFGADGRAQGAYLTDEPLVAVAFHPNGRFVVAGSARGLVTVLRYPELTYVAEQRPHTAEVRAFAFSDEGTLFSGSWDTSIIAFDTLEEEVAVSQVRLRFERMGLFAALRGTLDDRASGVFAIDGRLPQVVVSSELARTAGIDAPFLSETVTLPAPSGPQLAKLARGRSLRFKSLRLSGVDVAVCDACMPPGVHGLLGAPLLGAVDIAFDEPNQEAQLTLRATSAPERVRQLQLLPRGRLWFPWHVNDLSLDRSGTRLGVAFSEAPAQRTREIYEREKKKLEEPPAEGNAAAIVDARSGQILRKWNHHRGVVATAAISPDGERLASGGWDRKLFVVQPGKNEPVVQRDFGWSVRRVRFSRDGRLLAVAAWTPVNAIGDQRSDPSAVVFEVLFGKLELKRGAAAAQ